MHNDIVQTKLVIALATKHKWKFLKLVSGPTLLKIINKMINKWWTSDKLKINYFFYVNKYKCLVLYSDNWIHVNSTLGYKSVVQKTWNTDRIMKNLSWNV